MPPSRTLVIPMFREAGRIERTLEALATSELDDPKTELVLVDDGSDDGTADIAEHRAADHGLDVQVLRLPRNVGKGGAVRAGVLVARGEYVVFADADLLGGAADIAECFRRLEQGAGEVVFATRSHSESTITVRAPRHRVLIGRTYNAFLRLLGLTRSLDTQCGLKGFTAQAARQVFEPLRTWGFAFDIEVLARAEALDFRVVEMPIAWGHVEGSRVGVADGVRSFVDAVRVRHQLRRELGRMRTPTTAVEPMDDARYDVMAEVERDHWWFRAKRELVAQRLTRHGADAQGLALDVGCGTGAGLAMLGRRFARAVGTDLSERAALHAAGRLPAGSGPVLARAEALPFPPDLAAALISLDVVEHLDDDVEALREYRRVLRPGALVALTVPAYEWAWSDYDVSLGHRRRYTAGRLRGVVEAAGLEVVRSTYFHSWLVPVAFLVRRTPIGRLLKGEQEEAGYTSPGVNRMLTAVARAERAVESVVAIPFGLSILVVARRPASTPKPATSPASS